MSDAFLSYYQQQLDQIPLQQKLFPELAKQGLLHLYLITEPVAIQKKEEQHSTLFFLTNDQIKQMRDLFNQFLYKNPQSFSLFLQLPTEMTASNFLAPLTQSIPQIVNHFFSEQKIYIDNNLYYSDILFRKHNDLSKNNYKDQFYTISSDQLIMFNFLTNYSSDYEQFSTQIPQPFAHSFSALNQYQSIYSQLQLTDPDLPIPIIEKLIPTLISLHLQTFDAFTQQLNLKLTELLTPNSQKLQYYQEHFFETINNSLNSQATALYRLYFAISHATCAHITTNQQPATYLLDFYQQIEPVINHVNQQLDSLKVLSQKTKYTFKQQNQNTSFPKLIENSKSIVSERSRNTESAFSYGDILNTLTSLNLKIPDALTSPPLEQFTHILESFYFGNTNKHLTPDKYLEHYAAQMMPLLPFIKPNDFFSLIPHMFLQFHFATNNPTHPLDFLQHLHFVEKISMAFIEQQSKTHGNDIIKETIHEFLTKPFVSKSYYSKPSFVGLAQQVFQRDYLNSRYNQHSYDTIFASLFKFYISQLQRLSSDTSPLSLDQRYDFPEDILHTDNIHKAHNKSHLSKSQSNLLTILTINHCWDSARYLIENHQTDWKFTRKQLRIKIPTSPDLKIIEEFFDSIECLQKMNKKINKPNAQQSNNDISTSKPLLL